LLFFAFSKNLTLMFSRDSALCVRNPGWGTPANLGDRERGEIPDDDAKKQKRNERYEDDASRKQTTLHKVVVVQRLMGLNLND